MRAPRLMLLCVLLAGLGGCAYFNTYYNARASYKDGLKKKLESSGANAGEAQFKQSNTVSSKLLQFYPESRWVDDTILLIGLCYLEMGQHHRALRKFDELESNYPESRLIEPSRVWRARTYLELDRLEDCRRTLAALNDERLDREDQLQKLEIEGNLARLEEQWSRLAEIQLEVLHRTRQRARKGLLNLALGHTHEQLGDPREAVKHFGRVGRYHPGRMAELEAALAEVDNLIQLERYPRADQKVSRLEKDERFHDLADQIALRRASLLLAMGELEPSLIAYNALLEKFPRTPSAAAAAFQIGDTWLYQLGQADSARVYYTRSKQEVTRGAWADSSTARLADLDGLDAVRERLLESENAIQQTRWSLDPDSARVYWVRAQLGSLRTRVTQDSLNLIERARAAVDSSLRASYAGRLPELADSMAAVADSLPGWAWSKALVPPDTASIAAATPEETPLLDVPQRGGGRRKLFQNRRQKEEARSDSLERAVEADSLAQIAQDLRTARLDSLLIASVLDTLSHSPAVDSLAIAARLDSLALLSYDQQFELAELLNYRMRDPLGADSLMARLDSLKGSDLRHSRLLFSWALLKEESLKQPDQGKALLERLVREYPLSLVANPARDRLGLPRTMTVADSAAIVLADAERLWLSEFQPAQALARYQTLQELYPESEAALTGRLAQATIQLQVYGDLAAATEQWNLALRAFPDDPRLADLKARLGLTTAQGTEGSGEEEAPQVAAGLLLEERKDQSGHFVRPEDLDTLPKLLEHLRARFADTDRLRLERVLH
ncbi:MAG: tetratricopeptide repeat protein [Calditrichaeota bacterium]|nr:tetratricopeptide repeat protein [Calditrichota bacterium]